MAFHQVSDGAPDYEHLSSWLIAGDALYHFRSRARTQPYVLGGIGVIRASASRLCSTCVWNPDPVTGKKNYIMTGEAERGTDPAILLGGGFKAAVTRHFSIRGEFLFVRALSTTYRANRLDGAVNLLTGPWGWYRATIGAAVHF